MIELLYIYCPHSFGPKESPRRDEFVPQVCAPIRWPHCSSPVVHWFSFPSLQGKLTCEFKFAPFSCPHRRQYQQVCKGVCVYLCVCVWGGGGGGGGGGRRLWGSTRSGEHGTCWSSNGSERQRSTGGGGSGLPTTSSSPPVTLQP